jgi:hypothetical protein
MVGMKFRAKLGIHHLVWAVLGLFCLVRMCLHRHSDLMDQFFLLLALLWVLPPLTSWWKTSPEGLQQKISWRSRFIPWQEITRVSNWPGPGGEGFLIDFARPAPMSNRGGIHATPADREGFLAELKRYAPDAEFDLELETKKNPLSLTSRMR